MTNGHLSVLESALALADRVVLAVGTHPGKHAMFTPAARTEMLSEVVVTLPEGSERITIVSYSGLLVEAAREVGATIVVRGLRDASDFDAEYRMATMNRVLAPDLRTVFLPAPPEQRHISATLVRQIAKLKGNVSAFVPPAIARRLAELP